ncbi:MAG: hypothetical protein HY459_00680 [Parcubacteria group bacterium]|nr:hypothetical protein [Parcubacteria group bacterium]
MPSEQPIGVVTHYYSNIGVAVVELAEGALSVGDTIRIQGGESTDFTQAVTSMQLEHKPITLAKAPQTFGIKVDQHVRPGYRLFKV